MEQQKQNQEVKRCVKIAKANNITPDDLYGEAQLREEYGEFLKPSLLEFSADALKKSRRYPAE